MPEQRDSVEKKYPRRFDSAGTARSFIRDVANQFSDPELMIEFVNAIEIAEAALICWLIEEKKAGACRLRELGAPSGEFRLAVERLRAILVKLQ